MKYLAHLDRSHAMHDGTTYLSARLLHHLEANQNIHTLILLEFRLLLPDLFTSLALGIPVLKRTNLKHFQDFTEKMAII